MSRFRLRTVTPPTDLSHYPPLTQTLLAARNILSAEAADRFLAPNFDTHLHDPARLHDIDVAAARIEAALAAGERLGIFADYDCDGIPGAVILHDFLVAAGAGNFEVYIPHRHYEGFGLSVGAVETLHERGVTLIVTIDCGVTDVTAVMRANELGVTVIITDHHEPPTTLPPAHAIVNPKLGHYPWPELCGAAVVFKLVQHLMARGTYNLPPGREKWWLDMVGVATIADMVPLQDENRVLASFGLRVLRKSRRPGLQKLLAENRVPQAHLTEEDIGFTIGPRINAASRMDTPEDAFYLLASTDATEAAARVMHLEGLNQKRKTEVATITKQLHRRVHELAELPAALVFGDPEWRPSLVGLAANKLAEEYGRPVFLWGRDGNGKYKGSCRSGGDVSVVAIMRAASEVFEEYGGHHASGGFTIKDEAIFAVAETLARTASELGEAAVVVEPIMVDAALQLSEVTPQLLDELAVLAPFGASNHKPLFVFKNVTPRQVERFGKGKEHCKLVFARATGPLEAIAFFATPETFVYAPAAERACDVVAHVERSFFAGRWQIRLRVVEVLPPLAAL